MAGSKSAISSNFPGCEKGLRSVPLTVLPGVKLHQEHLARVAVERGLPEAMKVEEAYGKFGAEVIKHFDLTDAMAREDCPLLQPL